MLELLLSTQSGGYYPHSGPGSKILRTGDPELGFFGTVTDAELGGVSETLYTALKSQSFNPNRYTRLMTPIWGKWFFKGSVYYIPLTSLFYGVTLYDLMESGLAFGDDRPVNVHVNNGSLTRAMRNQNRRIAVKEGSRNWILIPRMPSPNTTKVINTGINAVPADSELGVLMATAMGADSDINRTERFRPITFMNGEDRRTITAIKNVNNAHQISEVDKKKIDTTSMEYLTELSTRVSGQPITQHLLPSSLDGGFVSYYRPIIVLDEDSDVIVNEVWAVGDPAVRAKIEFDSQNLESTSAIEVMEQLALNHPITVGDILYSQSISLDTSFRERAASTTEMVEIGRATEITFSHINDRHVSSLVDSITELGSSVAHQAATDKGIQALADAVVETHVEVAEGKPDPISKALVREVLSDEVIYLKETDGDDHLSVVDQLRTEFTISTSEPPLVTGTRPYWLEEHRGINEPSISLDRTPGNTGYAPAEITFVFSKMDIHILIEKV